MNPELTLSRFSQSRLGYNQSVPSSRFITNFQGLVRPDVERCCPKSGLWSWHPTCAYRRRITRTVEAMAPAPQTSKQFQPSPQNKDLIHFWIPAIKNHQKRPSTIINFWIFLKNPTFFEVVDLGCGCGLLAFLALRSGASKALAVEIAPHLARLAKRVLAEAQANFVPRCFSDTVEVWFLVLESDQNPSWSRLGLGQAEVICGDLRAVMVNEVTNMWGGTTLEILDVHWMIDVKQMGWATKGSVNATGPWLARRSVLMLWWQSCWMLVDWVRKLYPSCGMPRAGEWKGVNRMDMHLLADLFPLNPDREPDFGFLKDYWFVYIHLIDGPWQQTEFQATASGRSLHPTKTSDSLGVGGCAPQSTPWSGLGAQPKQINFED